MTITTAATNTITTTTAAPITASTTIAVTATIGPQLQNLMSGIQPYRWVRLDSPWLVYPAWQHSWC